MNKISTDINQSKKLIELGIDISTADMLWTYDFMVNDINGLNVISEQLKPEENDIPAWSLTALLKLLPKSMITTPNPLSTNYCCRNVEFDMEFYSDNPVDAAFEMVVWLKENNLKEK